MPRGWRRPWVDKSVVAGARSECCVDRDILTVALALAQAEALAMIVAARLLNGDATLAQGLREVALIAALGASDILVGLDRSPCRVQAGSVLERVLAAIIARRLAVLVMADALAMVMMVMAFDGSSSASSGLRWCC
jgi:hypothetical protein